jgi:glucose-specific phosphotransferase system IIA component
MGFFDRFKKAAVPAKPEALAVSASAGQVLACVDGRVIPLADVSDVVFNSGAMGKGCGIEPAGEVIYAPVSGTLTAAGAPNYHAVGITGDDGAEVLIHVGVDTVEMKGEGFTVHVQKGAHVSAGEPLLSFSREKISAAGHDTVAIMALTNTDDLASVDLAREGDAKAGDVVITFKK